MEIQVIGLDAERIDLKIGTLKIDLDAAGRGVVEMDGKRVKCCGFSIDVKAGKTPRISLEILPI